MIPTLNPQLLAAKLTIELLTWIVEKTTTASSWKWNTSEGAGLSFSTPFKLVGAGGAGGALLLQREGAHGHEDVTLRYEMLGLGIGIAPPTQVVTLTGSRRSFPSDGRLRLAPGQRDFDGPADFMLPGVGLSGPCAVLTIETTALVGGWAGSVMLLGIDDELVRIFRDMERHTKKLVEIMREPIPDGMWNRAKETVMRPARVAREELGIAFDQSRLLFRLQTHGLFKAALFYHGVEAAASEIVVTLSASITASVGVIQATNAG